MCFLMSLCWILGNLKVCAPVILLCPSPVCIPGEMRVQLLNQTLLDLGLYDDGPYEVADQKQLNAQLIPVPYHSYLGRTCPPCWLSPVHRRGREGRWGGGGTPGLRLHLRMLDKWASTNGGVLHPCWFFFCLRLTWVEGCGKMSRGEHCSLWFPWFHYLQKGGWPVSSV